MANSVLVNVYEINGLPGPVPVQKWGIPTDGVTIKPYRGTATNLYSIAVLESGKEYSLAETVTALVTLFG